VRAQAEGTLPYFPMVVLINEHAASASEVTSGALKDNKRALILGTRSFGKGSVQEPISLGDEGDLKLTVAYYYLPSGRLVHRKKDATDWGVEPDINVPMDEETQKLVFRGQIESDRIVSPVATQPATKPTTKPVDVQLQRAVEVLAAHIMMDPNNKGDLVRDVAAEQAPTTAPAAATPSTKPTEATPPAAPAAPATPATPATLPSTRPSTLPASDSGASK
jgi:carboxyl-terminal processing protease